MTRVSSQSYLYKISKYLIDKPSSFAHKEMSFLCFRSTVIIIGAILCFDCVSKWCYGSLPFKYQITT